MTVVDSFNRADENPLGSTNWQTPSSSGVSFAMRILSNQAAGNDSAAVSDAMWKTTQLADVAVGVTVPVIPGSTRYMRLYIRCNLTSSPTEGYFIQWSNDANRLRMFRNDSGSATQIGSASVVLAANDVVVFEPTGSSLRVKQNGITVLTVVDATYSSGGFVGMGVGDVTVRLDDFTITAPDAQRAYATAVVADTPWVYYKLDEASGSPVDFSGNGRTVTSIDGTISYHQVGPFLGSYSTKAADSSQFNRTSPPNTVGSIAVEMWVKLGQTPGSNARKFFSIGNATSGIDLFYNTDGKFYGVVNWISGPTTLSTSTAALSTSVFAHIVVTRESGTWKYYVNGVVDTASAGTQQMGDPSTQTLHVGTDLASDYSTFVSNFAYYTAALSSTSVASHYAAGNTLQTAYANAVLTDAPYLYYLLSEASGTPVDSSGNGRDISTVDGSYTYQQTGPFTGSYSVLGADNSQLNRTSPPNTVVSVAIEMWVKLAETPGSNARIFFNGGNSDHGFDLFYNTDGKFYARVNWASGQDTLSTSTGALSTSVFKHIVITRESGTWKYYINGALDTANAGTREMGDPSSQSFHFALDSGVSNGYSQYTSNVVYYTAALSAARVSAHYVAAVGAYEKAGTATSPFTGSGSKVNTITKAGTGTSARAGSGADAVTTSETGTGIAPFTGSGEKVAGAKFGMAIAPFTGSGARQISKNNRGSGVAVFTGSGTRSGSTLSKAGTGVSARTGTASDVVTYVESGKGIISNVAGGGTAVLAQGTSGGTTGETGNSATDSRGGILGGAYPTTTITGYCSNPILVNLTTGETMYWRSIELMDGEVMIVDHLNRSTKIDGVDAPGPSGEYWALIAEENTIQAGAEERGANFTVTMTYAEVLI